MANLRANLECDWIPETTLQAVERSKAQDMARLALTVDVKWGSYDPDGILPGDEEPPGPAGTSTSTS
jgi:hypothetical protein